jgi:hypothetical protein
MGERNSSRESEVLVRAEIAGNLPPRTTGCVPANEQCVCVIGQRFPRLEEDHI